MKKLFSSFAFIFAVLVSATVSAVPTVNSSNVYFTNLSTTSFRVNWTSGNGSTRLVVVRPAASSTATPSNGFGVYNASTVYGSGSHLGQNNYVVYKGSGSAVTVTGLSVGTAYRVTIFEYDYNIFTGNNYLLSGYPNVTQYTLDTEPTSPASGISVTNISPTQAYVSWTNGNGGRRLVSVRQSSTNTILPVDGEVYTASSTFGSGSNLGSGAYVVYSSTGSGFWLYGLSPEQQYTVSVFEYNGLSGAQNYRTSTYATGSFYSQAAEPTAAATDLHFTQVSHNSITVNCQRGNGARRIITARAASTNTSLPADFTTYTANATFGSGTQLATGVYVVYSGTDNNVTVTGLSPQTTYAFSVFEYNGTTAATINYLTSSFLTGSKATIRTEPASLASSISFSGVSSNSLTVNWTNGNGDNRIVAVRTGRKQTALAFDGSNDYVNIPHQSAQNSRPLTVSTWVKTTQTTGNVCLVNKYVLGSYNGYEIYMSNGRIAGWYFANNTNYLWPGVSPGDADGGFIADGVWHHVTYVVDNTGAKLYVDGALRMSNSWTGSPATSTTTQPLTLGYYPGSGTPYFTGQLDEVEIWNIALSQTQIRDNMNSSRYGTESGLIGYWKLDDGYATSATAKNSSLITGMNGTLTNFANTSAATDFTRTSGWVNSGATVNVPLDLKSYSANTTFLSGAEIDNGYYSVYRGTGTSVNVTGLAPGTYYNFSVYEFNGSSGSLTENYFTSQYLTDDITTSTAPLPTLTSFSPASGTVGTLVTINGTNFSANAAENIVHFGAVQATVSSATANQLVVIVPYGANYKPISVRVNSNVVYSAQPFVVTSSCAGTISFAAPSNLTMDNQSYANAIADIDGDGKPEILSTCYSASKLSVFRNLSASAVSFAAKTDFAAYYPVGIAIADFDGDGKKDVVLSSYISMNNSGIISFYRNISSPGSIAFADKVDFPVSTTPWSLAAGDIDKDGKTDVVIGYYSGDSISVLRNLSSAGYFEFATAKSYFIGAAAAPRKVAVADLDGDGKVDIGVASYSTTKVSVFRNTSTVGNISMATRVDYTTPSNARSIAIGDLDNDNKPDITVTLQNNAVRVLKNTSSVGTINASSFGITTDLSLPGGRIPDDVILVDIDGDGTSRTDIVTGYESTLSAVSVFKNVGSMSFSAYADYSTASASTPRFISGGDLNADGKPDIITSSSGTIIPVLQNTINPLVAEPNGAASGLNFTGVTVNSMTLNWTNGQGVNRVVIAKEVSSPVNQAPFDGVNYTANSVFGNGTHLGGNNYIVYNGNGTSVTVTGLKSNTTYQFGIFEYNGSVACELNYLTSAFLSGNKATLNIQPTLTAIGNPSAICQNSGLQTVNVAGISSGTVTESQTLVVTAISNNVTLIPHPTVSYTSPATTGTLSYTPNAGYGTAVITVTVDDGATNNNTIVRTFTVTVSQTPTTATTGGFQQICAGQTNLTGNAPSVGTGAWSFIYKNNAAISISNTSSPTSLINNFNVGDTARVRWTISNGGCPPSFAEMSVKRINCPLTADFTTTSATTQCLNASPTVMYTDASSSSGTNILTWTWSFGAGATPSTATGVGPHSVTYSTAGAKTVTLTVTDDAAGSDSEIKNAFVTINDVPSAAGTITGQLSTVCQGQSGVLYYVGTIAGATSYSWTLPSGAVISSGAGSDSIYVDFGLGALSGNVTVEGTNSCGNGTASTAYPITVSPVPSAAGVITGSLTVCEGTSGVVYSVPSITNAITHVWSVPSGATIINGSGTNSITVDFTGAVSGTIKVYGQNSCGKGDSTEIAVTVNPLPDAAGTISGLNNITLCPLTTGVNYSIGFLNNANYYLWTLPSGATITSGDSTNSIIVDYSLSSVSGNITVKGVNSCGDGTLATLPINIYTVPNIPICLVTVDSTSTYNRIVWEKPITSDVDSFRIYREITSSFVHIASVHYDSLSVYDDNSFIPAANPNVTSFRYKISVIDTCGNEWNLSNAHRTIHLQANVGVAGEVNLNWNSYEGAAVSFYRILRDSFGTGNFIVIDSVPGGNISWSDYTPPVSNNLGYALETNWGVSCSPTEATISTTRSNLKGGLLVSPSSIQGITEKHFLIAPNPNRGVFAIEYPSVKNDFAIEIYNSIGQKVYADNLLGAASGLSYGQFKQIDISGIPAGVYSVIIYNKDNSRFVKKLIVN